MGKLTSTAMWLTTAVWLGSRMSLVWWSGEARPFKAWAVGEDEPWSTIKAPLTLILTLPGWLMVLSISAVVVAVLGLPICSAAATGSWPADEWAWSPCCDGGGGKDSVMMAGGRAVGKEGKRRGWSPVLVGVLMVGCLLG